MIVALVALFVALGGTATAAVLITGKQVKDGSLTGADIKKKSLTRGHFKGPLSPGPAGPKGDRGDAGQNGTNGQNGAPGAPGQGGTPGTAGMPGRDGTDGRDGTNGTNGTNGATNVIVSSAATGSVGAGESQRAFAACPSGQKATGGGISPNEATPSGLALLSESRPAKVNGDPVPAGQTPVAWSGVGTNRGTTGAPSFIFTVYVVCAAP